MENSDLNEKEKKEFLLDIKKQNIKLINELYLNNLISVKVILDCFEFLKKNPNENKIILLIELYKGIYRKFEKENPNEFQKAFNFFEKIT